MARILYRQENGDGHSTRRALGGHLVDSLAPGDDASELLSKGPPYDLALVSISLSSDQDREAGELLDLLVARYPDTRRVALTGWPPRAHQTAGIFDRYLVDEIIVQADLDARQLRRAVENTLLIDQGRLPSAAKIERSRLRQEVRDSKRVLGAELRDQIVGMEEYLRATFRVHGQGRRVEQDIERARARLLEFESAFDRIGATVDRVSSLEATDRVRAELELTTARYSTGRGRGGR